MHSELTSQIESFVACSRASDETQLLALLQGRKGAASAQVAAVILGAGFQARRWSLGTRPDSPTVTKVTSFAELCLLKNRVRLLRMVVEAGAPSVLAAMELDRAGWLRYLCRSRRPDGPRELRGDAYVETSLFVLASDATAAIGGGGHTVLEPVRAANVIDALRLALEVVPGDPGIEVVRRKGSVARALLASAEMAMVVSARTGVATTPPRRKRLAL